MIIFFRAFTEFAKNHFGSLPEDFDINSILSYDNSSNTIFKNFSLHTYGLSLKRHIFIRSQNAKAWIHTFYVDDVEESISFYKNAFGLESGFVDTENKQFSELITGSTKFDKAVAAGATPISKPQKKAWGQTVSYVRDLNGFLVELCSEMT